MITNKKINVVNLVFNDSTVMKIIITNITTITIRIRVKINDSKAS